jgi:hypothetical protein
VEKNNNQNSWVFLLILAIGCQEYPVGGVGGFLVWVGYEI